MDATAFSAPNTNPTADRAKGCNECSEREKRAVGHFLQLDRESTDPRRMPSTLELPQPLFALERHDVSGDAKVIVGELIETFNDEVILIQAEFPDEIHG